MGNNKLYLERAMEYSLKNSEFLNCMTNFMTRNNMNECWIYLDEYKNSISPYKVMPHSEVPPLILRNIDVFYDSHINARRYKKRESDVHYVVESRLLDGFCVVLVKKVEVEEI